MKIDVRFCHYAKLVRISKRKRKERERRERKKRRHVYSMFAVRINVIICLVLYTL